MELLLSVLRLLVFILALPIFLLHFLGVWSWICKRLFPCSMVLCSAVYRHLMLSKKQELFSNLQEFTGPSGKLSLLELGCGTGANFQFYPPGTRVTCIDPNPNFEKYLIRSVTKNQHLKFERFVVAAGEDLHQVAEGSVDVVVCTTVLCSVQNQEQTLREVRRVLRPGGAFFFLEHVAAEHSSWTYIWQQAVNPLWNLLFDGCNVTRQSWKSLEQANFSKLKLQHLQAPLYLKPVCPHISGYAVK